MKLSIIIPVYNVELYIESCLLSVLNQTDLNDAEIILVDDCCTDNSMKIVERIVKENSDHTNINIIRHTHNQGLSAARNTGIKHAKGEYVFFLDSDDELPENTIKIFNNYLTLYGNAVLFIGNYIIDGPFNGTILRNTKIEYNNDEIFNAYIKKELYVLACGKFINRDYLISNNLWFPVKRLHEDEYFSFHLAYTANKLIVIKENVYVYKIRENSITTKKKRKNYIDTFWIIEDIIKTITKSNLCIEKKNINNYFITILYRFSIIVSISNLQNKEKMILLKWTRKYSNNFINGNYNLKNIIQFIIINLPNSIISKLYYILHHN